MSDCNWVVDEDTGAEILLIDGVEKVRISDAKNMRTDKGKSGSSTISVDDLKEQLEKLFECS